MVVSCFFWGRGAFKVCMTVHGGWYNVQSWLVLGLLPFEVSESNCRSSRSPAGGVIVPQYWLQWQFYLTKQSKGQHRAALEQMCLIVLGSNLGSGFSCVELAYCPCASCMLGSLKTQSWLIYPLVCMWMFAESMRLTGHHYRVMGGGGGGGGGLRVGEVGPACRAVTR